VFLARANLPAKNLTNPRPHWTVINAVWFAVR
jgi:hypothetical protein